VAVHEVIYEIVRLRQFDAIRICIILRAARSERSEAFGTGGFSEGAAEPMRPPDTLLIYVEPGCRFGPKTA
jgi:hypothetical protein